MAYCTKCGRKLNDSALFCDKCGTAVNTENEEKNNESIKADESTGNLQVLNNKKKIIVIASAIFVCIAIAASAFLMLNHNKSKETNNTATTGNVKNDESVKASEVTVEELSDEEKFCNEFFSDKHIMSVDNAADTLIRNPDIFKNAKIEIYGTIASTLPTDSENAFSYDVDVYEHGDTHNYININGTYKSTDTRWAEGDINEFVGIYSGIAMLPTPNGETNIAKLDNCMLYKYGYSAQEVKAVIKTIFGENIDVRSETDGARPEDLSEMLCYTFYADNAAIKWAFLEFGDAYVSLDNGEHWSKVQFSDRYKKFYATEQRTADNLLVVKYCNLDGSVIWSKEFSSRSSSGANSIVNNGEVTFLLLDNNLYVLNTATGEEIMASILVNGFSKMVLHSNVLLLFNEEAGDIVAMDTNCNRLWQDNVGSEYSLHDFQPIGDDVLVRYYNIMDNTAYHFRRLKIDSGEVIYELNI